MSAPDTNTVSNLAAAEHCSFIGVILLGFAIMLSLFWFKDAVTHNLGAAIFITMFAVVAGGLFLRSALLYRVASQHRRALAFAALGAIVSFGGAIAWALYGLLFIP